MLLELSPSSERERERGEGFGQEIEIHVSIVFLLAEKVPWEHGPWRKLAWILSLLMLFIADFLHPETLYSKDLSLLVCTTPSTYGYLCVCCACSHYHFVVCVCSTTK